MKSLAGVHMLLNPGGSRELHCHAIAAAWAFVIGGRCQTVVLDPSGQTEVNNYMAGDLWFFLKGFNLASVNEWPISTAMYGGLMVIKPGQMKELHWYPNANEFQYFLKGNGPVAMFGSGGLGGVADVKAGDSAYIPAGYGHAVLNTGTEDLEIVQTWDAGKFEEITPKHWMETAQDYLLSNNMAGVPPSTLEKIRNV